MRGLGVIGKTSLKFFALHKTKGSQKIVKNPRKSGKIFAKLMPKNLQPFYFQQLILEFSIQSGPKSGSTRKNKSGLAALL